MADIGTDHGLLPIYLAASGVVPRAFACDKRDEPLRQARRNIAMAGVGAHVQIRHGDGLRAVRGEQLGTVTIAGMGSATIAHILRGAADEEVTRYVLAPNDDGVSLRETIHALGFRLDDERIILEDGRFYPVLVVTPDSTTTVSSDPPPRAQILLGAPLHLGGNHVRQWLQLRAAHLAKHLGATAGRRPSADASALREDLDILRAFLFRAERCHPFLGQPNSAADAQRSAARGSTHRSRAGGREIDAAAVCAENITPHEAR